MIWTSNDQVPNRLAETVRSADSSACPHSRRSFSMLKWYFRKRIDKNIEDAKRTLAEMRQQIRKGGSVLAIANGEGIGGTAGLLAERFNISVPNALECSGLDRQQLYDGYRVLAKAMETMRPHLRSESEPTRIEAMKMTAGGAIFTTLFRLRGLTTQAPDEEQRARVAEVAETYAQFARLMAEIGAGIRDPAEAYLNPSPRQSGMP